MIVFFDEKLENKNFKMEVGKMKKEFTGKKLLKYNKGFSMVELLIGLLIIAVIAAASLTLLGGVLNTSKTKADQEAAETIQRALEGYIHATNDVDLSAIGVVDGTTETADILTVLASQITIDSTSGTTIKQLNENNTFDASVDVDDVTDSEVVDPTDIPGTFGPFLDSKKNLYPQAPGMKSWEIHINMGAGSVLVKASPDETTAELVTIVS